MMTRVKVITDTHTTKDIFLDENLQGVEGGGAINGEVGEALSSNRDGKEEALKGRFKVSVCWWPSSSKGPQKHDLTTFLEYNT